jgi:hypothetical protein
VYTVTLIQITVFIVEIIKNCKNKPRDFCVFMLTRDQPLLQAHLS